MFKMKGLFTLTLACALLLPLIASAQAPNRSMNRRPAGDSMVGGPGANKQPGLGATPDVRDRIKPSKGDFLDSLWKRLFGKETPQIQRPIHLFTGKGARLGLGNFNPADPNGCPFVQGVEFGASALRQMLGGGKTGSVVCCTAEYMDQVECEGELTPLSEFQRRQGGQSKSVSEIFGAQEGSELASFLNKDCEAMVCEDGDDCAPQGENPRERDRSKYMEGDDDSAGWDEDPDADATPPGSTAGGGGGGAQGGGQGGGGDDGDDGWDEDPDADDTPQTAGGGGAGGGGQAGDQGGDKPKDKPKGMGDLLGELNKLLGLKEAYDKSDRAGQIKLWRTIIEPQHGSLKGLDDAIAKTRADYDAAKDRFKGGGSIMPNPEGTDFFAWKKYCLTNPNQCPESWRYQKFGTGKGKGIDTWVVNPGPGEGGESPLPAEDSNDSTLLCDFTERGGLGQGKGGGGGGGGDGVGGGGGEGGGGGYGKGGGMAGGDRGMGAGMGPPPDDLINVTPDMIKDCGCPEGQKFKLGKKCKDGTVQMKGMMGQDIRVGKGMVINGTCGEYSVRHGGAID